MATQFDVTAPLQVPVGTYVRARGRRLVWVAVLIPLLAAVVTAGVLLNKPVPYESTLRVVIPEELGVGSSAIGLYLANLEQRLLDPEVVEKVTSETAVSSEAYLSNIRLARIGQSSDAEFSFVATSPSDAQAVVETAASAALRSLAEEGLPFAKREVNLAERSYREAIADLERFRQAEGVAFPQEQYRQVTTELQAAQADLAEAESLGDPVAIANTSAAIEQLEDEHDKLERTLPEYQQLDDARMVALNMRSQARDRLARKQAEIRLTEQDNLRRDVSTRQTSQGRRVLQGAAAAAAVALFLELGVIVLPDLVRPRNREIVLRQR